MLKGSVGRNSGDLVRSPFDERICRRAELVDEVVHGFDDVSLPDWRLAVLSAATTPALWSGVPIGPTSVLPNGCVDLYVHAAPDLIPRHGNDVELARSLRGSGLRAALHRHHFTSTVAQTALARSVTGFDLFGAVDCSDVNGGLNAMAVEYALAMGAVWVALPTLSSAHHRQHMRSAPAIAQAAVGFGPAELRLIDDDGKLLPQVHEVIEVADAHDVPVCLGYGSLEECLAVVNGGRRSAAPFVVTNPVTTSGWALADVEAMIDRGVVVELTAYTLHRHAIRGETGAWLAQARAIIGRAGREGAVISSDSGTATAPGSAPMLTAAWTELERAGTDPGGLERLFRSTPAALLGVLL
jgi:hypothetical protein